MCVEEAHGTCTVPVVDLGSMVLEKEGGEDASTRTEDAGNLVKVVPNVLREHMCEDGDEEDEIEACLWVWEGKGARLKSSPWAVEPVVDIEPMEMESWKVWRDGLTTPPDGLFHGIKALVGTVLEEGR